MPESVGSLQLNHVTRITRDLEASCKFYVEVLGCDLIPRPAFSFNGLWLHVAGMQFHLIEDLSTPAPAEGINTRKNHVAFAVNDLDAAEQRLREHGILYKRNMIVDRQIHQIFFRDPDGWLIEISGNYGAIDR
jgi:catechol 2,3-dioxygenase-like lactoylglutathione lyase family enzyme